MTDVVETRDVAAYILQRVPDATDMKLYKLMYYVQAWNVAWEGHPLFDDRIEAWRWGPVPVNYRRERTYGLTEVARPLPQAARAVVDSVLDYYGRLTAGQLMALSHSEAPWHEARGDIPDDAPSNEPITVASMRRFYTKTAMTGGAPKRASQYEPLTTERVLEIARRQMPRWAGTLKRLADR